MPVEHRNPLVAELWLRGAHRPVHARLTGPPARCLGPLVVLLGDADGTAAWAGDAVTLALPATLEFDDALAAICWAADHARELGGRSGALMLAGAGAGAALARRLAARAEDDGWPEIDRVVLA